MKTRILWIALVATMALTQTSCEKVSPQGVLMAGTGVEDRVEMSQLYYKRYLQNSANDFHVGENGYSFIVGGDSHLTTDPGRMDEMLAIGLEHDDLMYCHLGDIADTKAAYYITLDSLIAKAKERYVVKNYELKENGRWFRKDEPGDPIGFDYNEIRFPFFPVVGNHDLTHNGWGMWSNIFHSSFYEFDVWVGHDEEGHPIGDHFIFLDTASGTLGKLQVDLIEQGLLDGDNDRTYRNTFVFSHTNIFRPSSWQFASTFPREETYFLLNQFEKWNTDIVFCGHVHAWEERQYNWVTYLTLDSMSERNSPNPGDYLVRINVSKDGTWSFERVHMNYVAKK